MGHARAERPSFRPARPDLHRADRGGRSADLAGQKETEEEEEKILEEIYKEIKER